jgi:hypothetical protein
MTMTSSPIWTMEDVCILLTLFLNDEPLKEITNALDRSLDAVDTKLRKLAMGYTERHQEQVLERSLLLISTPKRDGRWTERDQYLFDLWDKHRRKNQTLDVDYIAKLLHREVEDIRKHTQKDYGRKGFFP